MLEAQHQMAGSGIVAEHGAGPDERRRVAQAGAAERAGAIIQLERIAAARANRRCDKGDLGPTRGAERALLSDHGAAFQALMGKQQIEHGTKGGPNWR